MAASRPGLHAALKGAQPGLHPGARLLLCFLSQAWVGWVGRNTPLSDGDTGNGEKDGTYPGRPVLDFQDGGSPIPVQCPVHSIPSKGIGGQSGFRLRSGSASGVGQSCFPPCAGSDHGPPPAPGQRGAMGLVAGWQGRSGKRRWWEGSLSQPGTRAVSEGCSTAAEFPPEPSSPVRPSGPRATGQLPAAPSKLLVSSVAAVFLLYSSHFVLQPDRVTMCVRGTTPVGSLPSEECGHRYTPGRPVRALNTSPSQTVPGLCDQPSCPIRCLSLWIT